MVNEGSKKIHQAITFMNFLNQEVSSKFEHYKKIYYNQNTKGLDSSIFTLFFLV